MSVNNWQRGPGNRLLQKDPQTAWHVVQDIMGPLRIAYFCDGHVKNIGERGIAKQCNPPALSDGMLVP